MLYIAAPAADRHQKNIRGRGLGLTWNSDSQNSPTIPLIFTEGEKCKIWLRFSIQSNAVRSGFETKQHIWNLKDVLWAPMIAISSSM